METKDTNKTNTLLLELRAIRDKISQELKGKSAEEVVEFLKKKKTLHHPSTWGA